MGTHELFRGARRLIGAAVLAMLAACSAHRSSAGSVSSEASPPTAPSSATGPRTRPATAEAPKPAESPTPPDKGNGPRAASLRNGESAAALGIGTGPEALAKATALGPDALAYYKDILFLADPALEGRSADVKGNAQAAAYIEERFRALGLEPAFHDDKGTRSYQQPFKVRGDVEVHKSEASFEWRENLAAEAMPQKKTFEVGKDFNVLGCSGTGEVSGELVFAGYSMEDGPDNYTSYSKEDDLKGKIALVLRFEPMTPEGKSKWTSFGRWSPRAELAAKVKAAAARGAAGVIIASPPGADDPRTEKLETARTTRFGGVNLPVVMMTIQAVNEILEKADPEKRTLLRLRQAVDEKGGLVSFGPLAKVNLATNVETKQLPTTNVGAVLSGRGALAGEFVVIGGHYDHVGLGYVGGANPGNIGKVHPGADDNASGTCGVLLTAKKLKDAYAAAPADRPLRSVILLAFSGEEMGLLGSDYYVKNPSVAASSIICMLNMDMIGRMTDNKLEVDGVGTAENFETLIKPALDKAGFAYTLGQSGRGPSDHASFYGADIPVLHLFTGLHPDYHQPGDTVDKVNVEGAVKVVGLMTDLAMLMATHDGRLSFKATKGGTTPGRVRSNVRLGIAPGDYSGTTPGVLVGDVIEGASAEKAGIKKGDRLMKWNGEELPDVEAMMSQLSKHKPGDKVDLLIVRDGKEMTITVTLMGREPRGN